MKKGIADHPKTLRLAKLLGLKRRDCCGLLHLLFEFVTEYSPAGDIGRWSDDQISEAVDWPTKRADELIKALLECGGIETAGYLERSGAHRLIVHDWQDHAQNFVKKRLERSGAKFVKSDGAQTATETQPNGDETAGECSTNGGQTADKRETNGVQCPPPRARAPRPSPAPPKPRPAPPKPTPPPDGVVSGGGDAPTGTAPNPRIDPFLLNEADRLARVFIEKWTGQPNERKAASMILGLLQQGSDAAEIERAFERAGPGRQIWNVLKELTEIYESAGADIVVRDRVILWLSKKGDVGKEAADDYRRVCDVWLEHDKIPLSKVHVKVCPFEVLDDARQKAVSKPGRR